MFPEDGSRDKVGRKLTKRRPHPRRASMDIPDRFRDGDDAHEDVSAPKDKNAQYMGQSVFAMMAAAGSKADLRARFDDESASGEDEPDEGIAGPDELGQGSKDAEQGLGFQDSKVGKHRKRLSDSRLLRSLPRLRVKSSRGNKVESAEDDMSSSQILTPQQPSDETDVSAYGDAPVMSRMLQARAEMEASRMETEPGRSNDASLPSSPQVKSPATLAQRLMEIFDFEAPEEVISEYPCWLLQSVLLQGYMYITQKHICFYAYLPKKSVRLPAVLLLTLADEPKNVIVKAGYLTKRGRQNPKYNRYWFTLKGDVLTYYTNPSELYFPSGHIDLRYGISAVLASPKGKDKDTTGFSVTTDQRTYHFRADSFASAKEWVRQLQKVIFRSHNDGDSVKISLPLENVIDIEENPVIDFADTVKLRVIDNDETYAVDEYFFSFFAFGKDALNVLRIMVDDNGLSKTPERDLSVPRSDGGEKHLTVDTVYRRGGRDRRDTSPAADASPVIHENVRATLSPISPSAGGKQSPRPSCEWSRSSFDVTRRSFDIGRDATRRSFDMNRRSMSTGRKSASQTRRQKSPLPPTAPDSSESFENSVDREAESSAAVQSIDETNASASQILNRSDVFQSPTIKHHYRRATESGEESEKLSRESAHGDNVQSRSTSTPARTEASTEKAPAGWSSGQIHKGDEDPRHRPVDTMQRSSSSTALQGLVRAGSTRASGLAVYIKSGSKRMSNLLSTGPMGYYEKVSGMWAGGTKHYGNHEALVPDDQIQGPEDEEDAQNQGERFRAHFALPSSEKLQATYFGWLYRVVPLYGKIYISSRKFCFRSLLPGTRTKLVLPIKDIETVSKEKGFRLSYSGLVIVVRGHEELFFEFNQSGFRDDCAVTLLQLIESAKFLEGSVLLGEDEAQAAETAKVEHQLLQEARQDSHADHDIKMPKTLGEAESDAPPILFDHPRASIMNLKPTESLRITCLTIGSRGDVQPYIALCKGLIAEGHRPRIATHLEFGPWIKKHGIDFAPVEGDPAELMRLCVENGIMTFSFLKEAGAKFRGWLDELLRSAWKACQGSDILIESPSAMAGIHIAEALAIPYFRAFTMPWTRTRAYPHAFAVPDHKMGGAYNYFTYVMFETVFWKLMAGQVNRWRRKELGLGSTSLLKMQPHKIPFLYNFSPSVVIPPLDYSDWVRVTGYWFLDEASGWEPPAELLNFLRKAREDNKKIVYIGFGSIVVADPAALTKSLVESVQKADVRCVLSKGWSDRLDKKDATQPEVPLPEEIFQIKSAPHDWLFRQVDVAVHHGGAGTTGASLRAGIPTIIKPFFGDQFFFGSRVEDLGVGICMKKVNTSVFARALWEATHSERMIVKAKILGEQIRTEDGVGNAIQAIYRDLEYARTLIKKRDGQSEDVSDDFEESWTLIGDEGDPELARRIAEWEPGHYPGSTRGRQQGGPSASGGASSKGVSPAKGKGV